MLSRRSTFRCCQRLWMVSWCSSEKTSTTKRSGGQEAGCGASWACMGGDCWTLQHSSTCEMPLAHIKQLHSGLPDGHDLSRGLVEASLCKSLPHPFDARSKFSAAYQD